MFDDPELIDAFIVESREGLAQVENDLLVLESTDQPESECVNRLFRAIHSIKGSAGFLGLEVIGQLSHAMENLLSLLRAGELKSSQHLVDELLRSSDQLSQLIEQPQDSHDVDVSAFVNRLDALAAGNLPDSGDQDGGELDDNAQRIVKHNDLEFVVTSTAIQQAEERGEALVALEVDMLADREIATDPRNLLHRLEDTGTVLDAWLDREAMVQTDHDVATLPMKVLVSTILDPESICRFWQLDSARVHRVTVCSSSDETGDVGTAGEETTVESCVSGACESLQTATTPHQTELVTTATSTVSADQAKTETVKPSADESSPSSKPSVSPEASVRVPVGILDRLMNLAGELVLGRNQLLQTVATKDHSSLDQVAGRLNQVTTDLQETIMQTRLQPIGIVFNKFHRVVRDLSRTLGKQCRLEIEGEEVELDKTIVEAISDPMTHLIRNAMDHGLESPAEREAMGKHPVGRIRLQACHQEGKVSISIADDGAGIDVERVKRKAIERGVITQADADDLTAREALRLIFHPGLSTAETISAVSGRGVGMDVVKSNLEQLGGTVDLESAPGMGTTITVRLPLTLAIIPSLIVRTGDNHFAIPQVNIAELVRVPAAEVAERIGRVRQARVLHLRGSLLPLVDLHQVLEPIREAPECPTDERNSAAGALNIIVVQAGATRYGIVVEGLNDSEEIVVKPLGRHFKNRTQFAGATILGDGRVALILDVTGVARRANLRQTANELAETETASDATPREAMSTLLFTNHPDEYFGVPMQVVSRLERIRADEIDGIGGHDVLQYRGETLPLLRVEHAVAARPPVESERLFVVVFQVEGREVGLVAPELVDIVDLPTEIDESTFRSQCVLGSTVVNDRPVRLLDLHALAVERHPEWAVAKSSHTPGQERVVLLAEDSRFFRNKVAEFLQDEGWTVVLCEDGQHAWETLCSEQHTIDLVITDIEMPRMNGFEFCRSLRADARFQRLPVVALTSLAGEEFVQRGRAVGIDEYLVKLDRDALRATLARLLVQSGPEVKRAGAFT